MNYFVEWTPIAHDRLERIWMAAADKRDVLRSRQSRLTIAWPKIPIGTMRRRWASESTLIVEPLAVDFELSEAERKVFIASVWMIGICTMTNRYELSVLS